MFKYGWVIRLHSMGFLIMMNGLAFSLYRGCNDKKMHFDIWSNIWRKTKTPIDREMQRVFNESMKAIRTEKAKIKLHN